jgi:sporulation protein YlmC with PRC-barrel domain
MWAGAFADAQCEPAVRINSSLRVRLPQRSGRGPEPTIRCGFGVGETAASEVFKNPDPVPTSTFQGEAKMSKLTYAVAVLAVLSVPAFADTNAQMLRQMPAEALTVTDWYKQDVYDPNNNKIGEVMDVLLDKSGRVTSLIIGVGGFLGAGEKDVAVPFEAVRVNKNNKNNKKFTLVMNTTKDDLKSAPGFKYDRDTTTWVPESK